jgi:tRNA pseudouridine55 synthase
MTTTSGLLLIDKPGGLTSHDVVARLRRVFHERRIGHAGTLDPMATGLLVVALGSSTRLLRFAQAQVKTYTGTVRLGVATDSLDADGVVTTRADVPPLTSDEVNEVASTMTGPQQQVPPMVSAVKVGGRRLHEMAREGLVVERAARDVVIHDFTLRPSESDACWDFEVTCSVGTYVRVLLSDLALRLGTVGHLTALRRTSSGTHHVRDAWTLEALEALVDPTAALEAPVGFVEELPAAVLTDDDVVRVRRGQRVSLDPVPVGAQVAALDGTGALVAVLVPRGVTWKPEIVLTEVGSR